jgi:hypothetical protein
LIEDMVMEQKKQTLASSGENSDEKSVEEQKEEEYKRLKERHAANAMSLLPPWMTGSAGELYTAAVAHMVFQTCELGILGSTETLYAAGCRCL